MTYEEMQAQLAGALVTNLAHAPATKSVSARESVLIKTVSAMTHVVDRLEQQIAQLQQRVEELERRGYCGIWRDGKEYTPQSEVTHDGARWIAHKRTSDKPGASGDWTMIEKSASTTAHARNGSTLAAAIPREP